MAGSLLESTAGSVLESAEAGLRPEAYPPVSAPEKPYYVLSPGNVYNMRTRTIEKYGAGGLVLPAVIPAK